MKPDAALLRRAAAAGLQPEWIDTQGHRQRVKGESLEALLACLPPDTPHARAPLVTADAGKRIALGRDRRPVTCFDERQQHVPLESDRHGLPLAPREPGYYRLQQGRDSITLAVAPARCFLPQDAAGVAQPAWWGLSAQVYSLRTDHDGGLGNSEAVARLGRREAAAGAQVLALSPLHAAAPVTGYFSPYAPSHRGMLDWMQIDPAQVAGAEAWHDAITHSGQATRWANAQKRRLVDWREQYLMRRKIYQSLFQRWGQRDVARLAWSRHASEGGDALRHHAIFAAHQAMLAEHGCAARIDSLPGWTAPGDSAVGPFVREHTEAVYFEYFLQWLARTCWTGTQRALVDAGQRLGLLWDLAVGFVPDGSEAWQHHERIVRGATLGAPADAFNPEGQSWGITGYSPQGLRQSGYRPLIDLLRAMMARGGGIRIDHILGWSRLWLVPDGAPASDGAYLTCALDDTLRLLTLESWRHRCVVIGEDLGTVPDGLRNVLARRGVLGLDVLLFTRDEDGQFLPPEQWRSHAAAMSTTHDLPPLAGWRAGDDIQTLGAIQSWPQRMRRSRMATRRRDVKALDHMTSQDSGAPPIRAALRSVARSTSPLALIPVEDALGLRQQVNLPGTTTEHPNWRLRTRWDLPRLETSMQWIARQRSTVRHD
ncbi:4-alpha-glucanotransferase [Dyella sp.]|uniref:4-alpha-glucanotransferase n=1 Tax=Dyella sp. TaxID=1869338 RepID=UPI002ED656B9